MPHFGLDSSDYASKPKGEGGAGFDDIFPTETKGDGRIRSNNRNDGSAQGKASFKKKVPCRQCGFMLDYSRDDHSGGDLDGDGAGGGVTKTEETVTLTGGVTMTENVGDQDFRKGAGCPLCFSKNGVSAVEKDVTQAEPQAQSGGL